MNEAAQFATAPPIANAKKFPLNYYNTISENLQGVMRPVLLGIGIC
jgi:hypothetical protein